MLTQARVGTGETCMGPTLRPPRARVQYLPGDGVALAVSRALGCTLLGAKQVLYGPHRVNLRCAEMARVIHDADLAAYGHWVAPVLGALRGIPTVPLSRALEIQAQTADLDEDTAEKAYDLAPSPATAMQRLRALDTEIALALELRGALAGAWGLA